MSSQPQELKVLFVEENKDAASDAGGFEKEWFTVLVNEILSPSNGKLDSMI